MDLRFISDDTLRAMIERDKAELAICVERHLNKSTLLLSGSILEAVLVDFFLTFPRPGTTADLVQRAELHQLIGWAYQDKIISETTKDLATVVRNYRNLIHPGREKREQVRLDDNTAQVAASLLEMVLQDLVESFARRRGYSADQMLEKALRDSTARHLFGHLVTKMTVADRIKLFKVIPKESRNQPEPTVANLVELHSLLKQHISTECLAEGVREAYECLMESGSMDQGIFNLRFFASDLDLIADVDRKAVLDYVLGVLANSGSTELRLLRNWPEFGSLAKYYDDKEFPNVIQELFANRARQRRLGKIPDVIEDIDGTFSGEASDDMFLELAERLCWSAQGLSHLEVLDKMAKENSAPLIIAWAEHLSDRLQVPF